MADKQNVERLFMLPYFQQMYEQTVKPMTDMMGQILYANTDVDPRLVGKVTEEMTNQYIYQEMMRHMMDLYVEFLTDEEVEFLREAYQHPAFLKLQISMLSLMPRVVSWFEENQEIIQSSIKRALDEVV